MVKMKHLEYNIHCDQQSRDVYQTLWKQKGLELLQNHDSPHGQCVLDWGCGRGESMRMCRQLGYVPVGTDIDPVCLKLSSVHGKTIQIDVNRSPLSQFGQDCCDNILCFHVLEHVDNPKALLLDFKKMARKYIVIAVPNLRQLSRLFCRHISLDSFNEGHLQSWDHWHLRNLAEKHCDLKWVEWGYDATILTGNYLLERLIGMKWTVKLESCVFNRIFPYHSLSVIGIFSTGKNGN